MDEEKAKCDSIGLTTEIFRELKEQNKRLATTLRTCIISFGVAIVLVVSGFLIYLYQYDFSGNVEQTGIYTLVDSQGNVISSDIDQDQLKEILSVLNGYDKGDKEKN